MNIKNKNKVILWTLFAIFLVAGFGLGKVEKASAGNCVFNTIMNEGSSTFNVTNSKSASSQAECDAMCNGKSTTGCTYAGTDAEKTAAIKDLATKTGANAAGIVKGVCDGVSIFSPTTWINCFLLYVLRFLGMLLTAASTLFIKVIDVSVFNKVLKDNSTIYEMWGFVRDMLNVAFILVLLFSAFCTVFQISKYSYKNLLLTLVIMALLVNFSFPIARVIIDFSNVIMYYLINGLGIDSSSAFAKFSENSSISKIIYNTDVNSDTSYLIAAVVFIFIFAVTLLIIAVLLLIRIIVLAILVIFASVAFVGSVVPFLSSQASKWWDTLFRYCFFGPIMVFMLVVASKMMEKTKDLQSSFETIARTQSNNDTSIIGTMAFFMIPIVILWVGIGVAQSMSIAGAGAVVGRGQKFMKWVGGGVVGTGKWATYKGVWWGVKKTGAPGAARQRWDQYKKEGLLGSEKTAQREAAIAAMVGVKGALEKDMKKRAEEHKKNLTTEAELKTLASGGDAAAAFRLAEDKNMDQATYDAFTKKNRTPGLQGTINAKVKQNRADIAALNIANNLSSQEYIDTAKANPTWTQNQIKDSVVETAIGKLTAEKLADQDFVSIDQKMPAGPDKTRVINATIGTINGLSNSAKSELAKRLSPANRAAINKFAGSPPGPPII